MRLDAHQCPEVSNCSRLHPSGPLSNASGHSSVFDKKLNFLLRHRYGKTAASIQTIGQHRQDVNPYYGNYVRQKYNRPDATATLSGRVPDMVLCEAHYGKPVAQLSVWMVSACVRTPPREIKDRLILGLLSL
jgi:hypothetical protein